MAESPLEYLFSSAFPLMKLPNLLHHTNILEDKCLRSRCSIHSNFQSLHWRKKQHR